MNLLERALAHVAPRLALSRAQARHALRAYDSAEAGRVANRFRGRGGSANRAISRAQSRLRERAHDYVRNSPHGVRMLDVLVSHTVGTGIVPVSRTGVDRLDKRIDQMWADWAGQSDVEGVLSFGGQQALAVRAMIEGGESLLRLINLPADDRRGPVPLAVQVGEGDLIDSSRDGPVEGQRTRLGVVLGDWDRRLGYYLFRTHPDEDTNYATPSYKSAFVPKSEVCHLYRATRPGQVRGVSWFAPILLTAQDLADFIEATVTKARVESCFVAFEEDQGESNAPSPLAGNKTPDDDQERELAPGAYVSLPPGRTVKFAQPSTMTHFEPVWMGTLHAMAAGIGCTYDQTSGDLRRANYTSLRAGKIEFRRLVKQVQGHTIVPAICVPPRQRFIERLKLAGELRDRREGYPAEWVVPVPEPIDPLKDLNADIEAVRAGRVSPQEFIAAHGRDWRAVLDDFKTFNTALDDRELALSIDARRNQSAPLAEPPANAEDPGDLEDDGDEDDADDADE